MYDRWDRGGVMARSAGHGPGEHGQAVPAEDGAVTDPLTAGRRQHRHDHAPEHDAHGGHTDGSRGAHDGHDGHGGHHDHGDHAGMFRRLFWIMLGLAVPTVLLNGMFADLLGYELPDVPGIGWVSPVLGTVIYLWGGRPFLTAAVGELRSRMRGMMLLTGMAITYALVVSHLVCRGSISRAWGYWCE